MRFRCLFGVFVSAIFYSIAPRAFALDLSQANIADLNRAFDRGSLTSERLVQLCLARIATYDQRGPILNTIIALNPQAEEEARALDAERRLKGPRSALHGIPVVVKDLYDVEGFPTSGGFIGLKESRPWRDGWVAERLRSAGAVILAKTNLDDWFANAPDGASTLKGQMRNPYNLAYTPGGSSGGTGAAIAAWFVPVGFGTETGVSIRNPTSENSLVGLAPTYGLVSRRGQIMSAITHERAGPMARNIYDVAAVLTVVAGFDPEDLSTMASRGHIPSRGYTEFLAPRDGLRGARIGVLREMFRPGTDHAEGRALIDVAFKRLRDGGAIIYDPVETGLPLFDLLKEARVSDFEKRSATNLYLAGLGPTARYRSMTQMVADYPELLRKLAPLDHVGSLDDNLEYVGRLKTREVLQETLLRLMNRYKLDALIYPFKTLCAVKIGEKRAEEADNALSSQTGFPALVMPAGYFENGLPIGIEFLGRPFSEPTLFRIGSAFEAISNPRHNPTSVPPLPGEVVAE